MPAEDDQMRRDELEMVFEMRYKDWDIATLEREAQALLVRYKAEMNKQEVETLNAELEKLGDSEEDQRRQEEILRKIMALKR